MRNDTNLRSKTITGGSIKLATLVTKGIIQIVAMSIFARHISPIEFGIFGLVQVVIAFVIMFSEIGLGPAIIQRQHISPGHIRTAYTTSLISSALLIIGSYFIAPLLSDFFHEPHFVSVFRWLVLTFLFTAFGISSEALLIKNFKFKSLYIAELISLVVGYGFIGIPMALNDFGVWALLITILSQYFIKNIIIYLYMPYNLIPYIKKSEFYDLIRYGSGLTFLNLFSTVGNQVDRIIIGRTMTSDILGIYGRAQQIMYIPTQYIGQSIDSALFPAMSIIQNDKIRLSDIFLKGIGIVSLVLMPLSVYLYLNADLVIYTLLGNQWEASIIPFKLLVLVMIVKICIKISDSLIRASGNVYKSAWRKLIYAIMAATLCMLGQRYNLIGVIWGLNIATFINFLLTLFLVRSIVSFTYLSFLKQFGPAVILSLLIFSITYGSRLISDFYNLPFTYQVILQIVILLMTYSISLLLLARFFGKPWQWFLKSVIEKIPYKNRWRNNLLKILNLNNE